MLRLDYPQRFRQAFHSAIHNFRRRYHCSPSIFYLAASETEKGCIFLTMWYTENDKRLVYGWNAVVHWAACARGTDKSF